MPLLSGNEAIARGALECGVKVATGYPGTPSTEIIEETLKYPEIYSQWSPNEKVAMEVAIGASLAGSRAMVTMKHVGLNVAADPLMTVTEIGVNGGLVIVCADDPGMHSSQNEQDNRFFGKFAKIPVLEPTDSQEAKDMLKRAFALSEEFDTPVLYRITTRIAHSKTLVELSEIVPSVKKDYVKNPQKQVMIPAHGRMRHKVVEERLAALTARAEETDLNTIERQEDSIGVITNGIGYQYVKEAIPNASVLKLGMTYPLPAKRIKEFADSVKELWVVEEGEPFIEEFIKTLGIPVSGKEYTSKLGELSVDALRQRLPFLETPPVKTKENYLMRPPVMCPGCPHRGAFHVLSRGKYIVSGDIGCYTLGMMPPQNAMDLVVCMGASIPMTLGMEKGGMDPNKVVAVIGDSTFFHSGITGLIDVIYNQGHSKILILDNNITAMTGHQEHAGTGRDPRRSPIPHGIDLVKLVSALGVEVRTVDPLDIPRLQEIMKEPCDKPMVVICQRPCALIVPSTTPYEVDQEACRACKACIRTGCPALCFEEKSSIDANLCTGCGLCATVCPFHAIKKVGEVSA